MKHLLKVPLLLGLLLITGLAFNIYATDSIKDEVATAKGNPAPAHVEGVDNVVKATVTDYVPATAVKVTSLKTEDTDTCIPGATKICLTGDHAFATVDVGYTRVTIDISKTALKIPDPVDRETLLTLSDAAQHYMSDSPTRVPRSMRLPDACIFETEPLPVADRPANAVPVASKLIINSRCEKCEQSGVKNKVDDQPNK